MADCFAISHGLITWAERNCDIFVADNSAGLYRGNRIVIDRDTLLDPHRNMGAVVMKSDRRNLADVDARELHLVTGLEARNIVEVREERVGRAGEQFDPSEAHREDGEGGNADEGKDANDQLSGAAGVHTG